MRFVRWRLGAAAFLAAVLTVAGLMTTAPANAAVASGIVKEPFVAVSSDSCGYTRGTLGWHLGEPIVDVTGRLIDHPTADDPGAPCAGDARQSVATFLAYAGGTLVDFERVQAENQVLPIDFSLTGRLHVPIDRVTIQVCRVLTGSPALCGDVFEYRGPLG